MDSIISFVELLRCVWVRHSLRGTFDFGRGVLSLGLFLRFFLFRNGFLELDSRLGFLLGGCFLIGCFLFGYVLVKLLCQSQLLCQLVDMRLILNVLFRSHGILFRGCFTFTGFSELFINLLGLVRSL